MKLKGESGSFSGILFDCRRMKNSNRSSFEKLIEAKLYGQSYSDWMYSLRVISESGDPLAQNSEPVKRIIFCGKVKDTQDLESDDFEELMRVVTDGAGNSAGLRLRTKITIKFEHLKYQFLTDRYWATGKITLIYQNEINGAMVPVTKEYTIDK